MRDTLGRKERLKSRKLIEELFSSGKWMAEGPMKMVFKFIPLGDPVPAQAGVSVPKSVMKRAVDRNRSKRFMREAYRKNKEELYRSLSVQEKQCALMFIFKGDENVTSGAIEQKISSLLQRLLKEHG